MKKSNLLSNSAIALTLCVFSLPIYAASFTVTNGNTVGAQVLNSGETGTVNTGGTVNEVGANGSGGGFSFGGYATSVEISNGVTGVTVINDGTINATAGNATTGNYNYGGTGAGIQFDYLSAGTIFTNNGTLTASGGNASGGGNANTAGDGFAINAASNNNTVINNGTITGIGGTASGANFIVGNGYGIYFDGTSNNNNITNNGTITASGPNAYAIRINGSGNTTTNYGTLSASGTGTNYSYYDGGTNNKLVIGPNSHFNAPVGFFGTGAIVEYTSGQSFPSEGGGFNTGMAGATPDFSNFTGTYTVNVINNGTGIVPPGAVLITSGGNTYAATPDVFANSDQLVVTQSAAQAGNLIVQRQQLSLLGKTTPINGELQFALNDISDVEPAAGGDGSGLGIFGHSSIWIESFGDYQERPQDGLSAQSRARSGGLLAGIDLPTNADGYRTGVYAGAFSGSNEMGKTTFRTIDSSGGLVGGYIGYQLDGGTYISTQLAVGFADNDSERSVGTGTAKSSYGSYFVSPALTILKPYATKDVTWVPSVTVRYTAQYAEDYSEHGSSANEDVDSRTSQTIGGRAQVEAHIADQHLSNGTLTPTVRVGVDGQKALGNGKVDLTVLGSSVSLNTDGGEDNVDGIVGGNLSYRMESGVEVYVDGEASLGLTNGGITNNIGGTARLGARWRF